MPRELTSYEELAALYLCRHRDGTYITVPCERCRTDIRRLAEPNLAVPETAYRVECQHCGKPTPLSGVALDDMVAMRQTFAVYRAESQAIIRHFQDAAHPVWYALQDGDGPFVAAHPFPGTHTPSLHAARKFKTFEEAHRARKGGRERVARIYGEPPQISYPEPPVSR